MSESNWGKWLCPHGRLWYCDQCAAEKAELLPAAPPADEPTGPPADEWPTGVHDPLYDPNNHAALLRSLANEVMEHVSENDHPENNDYLATVADALRKAADEITQLRETVAETGSAVRRAGQQLQTNRRASPRDSCRPTRAAGDCRGLWYLLRDHK